MYNDIMSISMMMMTTVVMTMIIKEESKEHGRTLVAIAAYSQVDNLFLTRKYESFLPGNVTMLNIKFEFFEQKI